MTSHRAIATAYAGFAAVIAADLVAAALFSDQRDDVAYWVQAAFILLPWGVWSGWIAWWLARGTGWRAAYWMISVFTGILIIGVCVSYGIAGAEAFSFRPFDVMQAMRVVTFLYVLALWPATVVAARRARIAAS